MRNPSHSPGVDTLRHTTALFLRHTYVDKFYDSLSEGGFFMTEQEFRIEHDTMGEVKVPVNALWRAQTQRAVENFPILSPHRSAPWAY